MKNHLHFVDDFFILFSYFDENNNVNYNIFNESISEKKFTI